MTPFEILNHLVRVSVPSIDSIEKIRRRLSFLAHYTSIEALQAICRTRELWFSNPQFMNDLQEMTHGLTIGFEYASRTPIIENAFSKRKDETLYHRQQFSRQIQDFMSNQASDVYIFCTTAHDDVTDDGDLSMWRGYGAGGRGAAIVFNTNFLRDHSDSPLLIAEVQYLTERERMQSIGELLSRWETAAKAIDQTAFKEAEINAVVQSLFVSILLLALTTKHKGFSGEKEWRLIYLPFLGNASVLKGHLGYRIGSSGIEPKLKFPISPLPLNPPENWSFESIVHRIIFGPGMSDRLHRLAVERMLADCGAGAFTDRIIFSTIPLRL